MIKSIKLYSLLVLIACCGFSGIVLATPLSIDNTGSALLELVSQESANSYICQGCDCNHGCKIPICCKAIQ